LLQGKALSIEDTVDVLTLKNNADTAEDYATALHLLARAQVSCYPLFLAAILTLLVEHSRYSEGSCIPFGMAACVYP
jgi:hypothetical protein